MKGTGGTYVLAAALAALSGGAAGAALRSHKWPSGSSSIRCARDVNGSRADGPRVEAQGRRGAWFPRTRRIPIDDRTGRACPDSNGSFPRTPHFQNAGGPRRAEAEFCNEIRGSTRDVCAAPRSGNSAYRLRCQLHDVMRTSARRAWSRSRSRTRAVMSPDTAASGDLLSNARRCDHSPVSARRGTAGQAFLAPTRSRGSQDLDRGNAATFRGRPIVGEAPQQGWTRTFRKCERRGPTADATFSPSGSDPFAALHRTVAAR